MASAQKGCADAIAYTADPRPLHCTGASFSSKTGTVEEWKVEEYR